MTEFAAAQAADQSPGELAVACAKQLGSREHNIGFVYVTSRLAGSLAMIVEILKEKTGVAKWVGTAGYGVCTAEGSYFGRPAVVALTARLPAGEIDLLPVLGDVGDVSRLDRPAFTCNLGIVHADPRNPRTQEIVQAVSSRFGSFLVGGLTAADGQFPQISGKAVEGGVSGVLIGAGVEVAVGLTQGCSPIGPTHTVTRGAGNFVLALDDTPALQMLTEDLGVADGVDPMPWLGNIHVALPVSGSDNGDYLVRNLMGIEPKQNIVVVAERVSPGDRLMFVRRDAESATKDLGRMIDELKARMPRAPKAGLYFSCCARGPNLFADEAAEMKAIRAAFGEIPLAGFFGNGEISHDRIYGYTGVLTLFF